jgi:hypothetical protein
MASVTPSTGGIENVAPNSFTSTQNLNNQTASLSIEDTINAALAGTLPSLSASIDSPILEIPAISLSSFFAIVNESAKNARQQLAMGEFIDQEKRTQLNLSTALQSLGITEKYTAIRAATALSKEKSIEVTNDLRTTAQNASSQVSNQNTLISSLNNGNQEEQDELKDLIQAYKSFTNEIKDIKGAEVSGQPGMYTIPSTDNGGPQDKDRILAYNNHVNNYNVAVANFNSYWNNRYDEIIDYSFSTIGYNANATANNIFFNEIKTTYNLNDTFNQLNLDLTQPEATFRNLTGLVPQLDQVQTLPANTSLPVVVDTKIPPDVFTTLSQNVPVIPNLSNFVVPTSSQLDTIRTAIYDQLYAQLVTPLQGDFDQKVLFEWGLTFLSTLLFNASVKAASADPLNEANSSIKKMLPNSISPPFEPKVQENKTGGGTLAVQVSGLGNPHIAALLGESFFSQVLNDLKIITESKKNELLNQLLIFTTTLLSTSSLLALLPALGLSDNLQVLIQNPSLFNTIFAAAFAASILDQIAKGGVSETLLQFIEANPLLANLSEADKTALLNQILPALNLTLALVAVQLLASTVGVPELLPLILSSTESTTFLSTSSPSTSNETEFLSPNFNLSPTFNPLGVEPESFSPNLNLTQLPNIFSSQSTSSHNQLRTQLTTQYHSEGFSSEQTEFLSDTGATLAPHTLSPTPYIIAENTVDGHILKDSIIAGIILADRKADLVTTREIVNRAVQQTFIENETLTSQQFKEHLEFNLRREGLTGNQAEAAVKSAVTISPSIRLEDFLGLNDKDILVFLSSRLNSLFSHIGAELGHRVSESIKVALYGRADPDSATIADVKSPQSLVNVIRNVLIELVFTQDREQFKTALEAFQTSIEEMVKPSEFLQKILEPAHLFLFSIGVGIMYSEPAKWKKSIDIPV